MERRVGPVNRVLKPKRCKVCNHDFTPFRSTAKTCSVHCALEWSRRIAAKKAEQEAKAERKQTREAKERLKTRGDHLRELQQAFNAWIRLRDAGQGCISCGRPATWKGQWDAGHYRSVGSAPELRFEPLNVNKQCGQCNVHLSGNLIAYRINLIQKIGLEWVEWLEGKHEPMKLTIPEIEEKKAFYRASVRRMKKES
jgi:hypothetical protein